MQKARQRKDEARRLFLEEKDYEAAMKVDKEGLR
jgi:hypothetical protein